MTAANAEQSDYWNGEGGEQWVEHSRILDEQLRHLGRAAMDAADFPVGARLLDIGCGCGPTSIELGERVGPEGSVLGVDIAEPMVQEAARQAAEASVANVSFAVADVQVEKFDEEFDGAFSRFGVMFFADPTKAFANLRKSLRVGGKLAFVAWQTPSKNPWMLAPMMAMGEHIKLPPRPAPGEPGPFSFGDADLIDGYLTRAGYTSISIEGLETEVVMGGGDVDAAIDFLIGAGRSATIIAEGGADLAAEVTASMRAVTEPRMGAAVWIVTAKG